MASTDSPDTQAEAISPVSLPLNCPVPASATGANTMPNVPTHSARQRRIMAWVMGWPSLRSTLARNRRALRA